MVKIIKGDLLEANVDIICQQVNCKGMMGAGLAKQIRNKYPEVYIKYKKLCKQYSFDELLGCTQYIKCHNGIYVANLFGQLNYRRDKQYTDYKALESCLFNLSQKVKKNNKIIGIPYELGCGLAGGDWNIVYKMINNIFFSNDDKITIYKFK